jgi:putative ATPase
MATDLFDDNLEAHQAHLAPLADRLRPRTLADFFGPEEVLGEGKILRELILKDEVPSLILWGPPGCGKTTLARIIAAMTGSVFVAFSAVTSGVAELRTLIKEATDRRKYDQQKTILFIDEIHRWNKAQQDALLPHVETGLVTLIGATTENPSFEVNSALLSRARVFVFQALSDQDLVAILKRALSDKVRGLGALKLKISDKVLTLFASLAGGDARSALNALEFAIKAQGSQTKIVIDQKLVKEAFQRSHLLYDRAGEEHYNIISALHKSLRGSDANAALYWLGRMLEAGEDPLYVARRLVRFASEDVGLANSLALNQAVAAYQACQFLGLPECNVILAQAVVYLAKCKKSNKLYEAYGAVSAEIAKSGTLPVPLHLRNAPTKLMKDLKYGQGYKYSPKFDYQEDQEYLPDQLKKKRFLSPD